MKKNPKKQKKPTTFIIGVVYSDDNKIEALSLYERDSKKGYLQSLKTVTERVIQGENILGISIREEVKFSNAIQDFVVNNYPVLDIGNFNYMKLNVLNGAGQVIFPGKDVIVGTTVEEDGTEYCVVVNSDYELRKVKKEDAIKQNLVGTFRETILRVCNEPMTL
ncbi:MAG: hypothetical protein IKY94_05380 [Lachnospiraceae bacterium]|nr:hypothetical protein [Lachnospiraceae bacterium]